MCKYTLMAAIILISPVAQTYADVNAVAGVAADENAHLSMKEHVTKWMLSDKNFVEKAIMGGHAEIEMSKLGVEKSQSSQVRDFANQMVKDHSNAAMQLKNIAQSKNLPIPSDLDRDHEENLNKLKDLNGADFDSTYLDIMQKDHDKTVTLFTAAAADDKLDKQLQQFAVKTLPVIRDHQSHVHALESKSVTSRQ